MFTEKTIKMREIRNNLREIRSNKGIKQSELADRSSCSQGRISDIENGRVAVENITLATALSLANALGCTIDDLFTSL